MSITSSATASGDRDVPSAEVIFGNKLCMISIARRDGTLMDASSISEEDIIEICIKKGHTHPLGVLCYSATESVILFGTTDKLKHATHGIIEIMEFQGEAIMVRAMAPSEGHVTAYIATLHKSPSNREKELQRPPQQTPPSGGTLNYLQAELGDLDDHKLHQLVEDLTQEIAPCEIHMPPRNPPPNEWVCPLGSRAQGGRPGGHLSWRGKVGSTEATHSTCRTRETSWR